jgi:hypothetical protein
MKTLIIILFTLTLFACRPAKNDNQTDKLNSNLLFGEWYLDSSSSSHWYGDRLIIRNDSSVFWFSGSDGGSLYSKGYWTGKDTLLLRLEQKMKIILVDSNRIHISGGWNNLELSFRKTEAGNLTEYLMQDSLRKQIIGWWKLTPREEQVRLINYSGSFTKLTLNIDDAGHATFYLANKYDSTLTYSYRMFQDGLSLQYGCIVSDSRVWFDKDKKMKLLLNRNDIDTLTFERLIDIK